jgi:3-oxoacyl-[acyl-carrier-protein] synthase II
MELRRVVVTGLGAITPLGNSVPEYWDSLLKGISGAGPITRFDASKFKTRFACEVRGFDPAVYFDRKEARKHDLYSHFSIAAADEALRDSGLDLQNVDLDRFGVIWGSGIGGVETFYKECAEFARGDGTPRFNPFFIPKMIGNIAGGQISIRWGLRGPGYTTVSACASSSNAIIDAYNYIRLGMADRFITGGSEAAINESAVGGFNSMHAMSTRNDDPQTASRPFDANRDGFVMGEGAGALILEEYEHAKKRGAKIYAEMVGCGLSSDAYHLTAPHPEGLGAVAVMRGGLEQAGLKPEDVDYINVHGTSTPMGDGIELKAIKTVFGDYAPKVNISSTKSMTGHLLGGAGAIEAIASIMAVVHNAIPPTINNFDLDPEIDPTLNLTLNKAQHRTVNVAISNTFGFGGHNASVIFKKYSE